MESIEKLVVDAVLERKTDVLTLDGHDYPIAPPTLATVILVSELAHRLPAVDPDALLTNEVMRTAKDCRVLGDIAAALILGARRYEQGLKVRRTFPKRGYFAQILRSLAFWRKGKAFTTEAENLAEIALKTLDAAKLNAVVVKRLIDMHIGDFFGLSASLNTQRILTPTREVENQTPSGE